MVSKGLLKKKMTLFIFFRGLNLWLHLFSLALCAAFGLSSLNPALALAHNNNQNDQGEPPESSTLYPDVPEDHWAREALDTLAQKYGLVMGYPDGSYQGNRALTRFEMAALLSKNFKNGAEIFSIPEGDEKAVAKEKKEIL